MLLWETLSEWDRLLCKTTAIWIIELCMIILEVGEREIGVHMCWMNSMEHNCGSFE